MKKNNDVTSYSHKILLVGHLSDFNSPIRELLSLYQLDIVEELPERYHRKNYSVIIFSSNCQVRDVLHEENKFFFYLSFSKHILGDIQITSSYTVVQIKKALIACIEYHLTKLSLIYTEKQHLIVSNERKNLSAIGVALSAEKDLDKLLGMVLKEGRALGKCEGASLYLIEKKANGEKELVFKLTQNSKINLDFREIRFPLTHRSLAGYVALNGEILNIKDVYQLDDSYPFSFDKRFDEKVNYRSKELLVLPMQNHKGKVIGVLQFVNTFGSQPMDDSFEPNNERGFSHAKQGLLQGLASQAAVAIDNSHLIENIQNLFEGFVSASVNAIESRDPVTSGHSFRVATLTTGLAEMLNKETEGIHKNLFFNNEQIKEIRYASLLHDFGKVGVKEKVLLKENKLHASRFQYLELKIDWQKQMLEKKFYQQLLSEGTSQIVEELASKNILDLGLVNNGAYQQLLFELEQLEQYKKVLSKANQPSLLKGSIVDGLVHMSGYNMHAEFPFSEKLINDADFLSLSISKGSLTKRERQDIQSHVVHTQQFLERIPWTDELAAIPEIAGAHHEKLDGTGYPAGLKNQQIPIPSKIMAIADIFDALVAQDRPYKKAVNVDFALDILLDEAKNGKIDEAILSTFIKSNIYQCIL